MVIDAPASTFQYKPLRAGTTEFRLLRLRLQRRTSPPPPAIVVPGSDDGGVSEANGTEDAPPPPLECEILRCVRSSEDCPPYVALSYAWNGDEDGGPGPSDPADPAGPAGIAHGRAGVVGHLPRQPGAAERPRHPAPPAEGAEVSAPVGKVLLLDGIPVPVSGTVDAALRELVVWGGPPPREVAATEDREPSAEEAADEETWRREQKHLHIWIDQLCIDQSSPQEKASQVAQMQDIYRCAKRVVAWMGRAAVIPGAADSRDETAVFFAHLKRLSKHVWAGDMKAAVRMHLSDDDWPGCRGGGRSVSPSSELAAVIPALHPDAPVISRAWTSLCNRRYWTRLWVIQEYASGSEAWILVGGGHWLREWDLQPLLYLLNRLFADTVEVRASEEVLCEWLDAMGPAEAVGSRETKGDLIQNAAIRLRQLIRDIYAAPSRSFLEGIVTRRTRFHMQLRLEKELLAEQQGCLATATSYTFQHRLSLPAGSRLFAVLVGSLVLEADDNFPETSDARDRVFSVLQLASDRERYVDCVDYERDESAAYSRIVARILEGVNDGAAADAGEDGAGTTADVVREAERDGNGKEVPRPPPRLAAATAAEEELDAATWGVDMLQYAQHPRVTPGLPTWVPDWAMRVKGPTNWGPWVSTSCASGAKGGRFRTRHRHGKQGQRVRIIEGHGNPDGVGGGDGDGGGIRAGDGVQLLPRLLSLRAVLVDVVERVADGEPWNPGFTAPLDCAAALLQLDRIKVLFEWSVHGYGDGDGSTAKRVQEGKETDDDKTTTARSSSVYGADFAGVDLEIAVAQTALCNFIPQKPEDWLTYGLAAVREMRKKMERRVALGVSGGPSGATPGAGAGDGVGKGPKTAAMDARQATDFAPPAETGSTIGTGGAEEDPRTTDRDPDDGMEPHWVVTGLRRTHNRLPFVTRRARYVGQAPGHVRVGDVAAVFLGGKTPYVIRPVEPRDAYEKRAFEDEGEGAGLYELVGEAYVHGGMFGEMVDGEDEVEVKRVVLR